MDLNVYDLCEVPVRFKVAQSALKPNPGQTKAAPTRSRELQQARKELDHYKQYLKNALQKYKECADKRQQLQDE